MIYIYYLINLTFVCCASSRQLQKQKREVEAKEFEALAEAGLNPYQVYRQRDIQAELEAEQSALAAGQAVRQEQVLGRLAAEDREYARKKARAAADAQVGFRCCGVSWGVVF